jgi:hypothetical protein
MDKIKSTERVVETLSKPGRSKLDDPYVKKYMFGIVLCLLLYVLVTTILPTLNLPLNRYVILLRSIQGVTVILYVVMFFSYIYKFYIKK